MRLKTTVCHFLSGIKVQTAPMFLLARGNEDHPKLFGRVAEEIANNLKYTKRPFKKFHFDINVDTATRNKASNVGDIIFRKLRELLGLTEKGQFEFTNVHGVKHDIRNFRIIVCVYVLK